MTEREMEDLLWEFPERLLNEPLTQFQRQPESRVGRADLVFKDKAGSLLIVEVKKGVLPRGAIHQLLDYYGMIKRAHPEEPVELMVVANSIPEERRLALERHNIEYREISETKFRSVAEEERYSIKSEEFPKQEDSLPVTETADEVEAPADLGGIDEPSKSPPDLSADLDFWATPYSVNPNKAWYYTAPAGREPVFLAFVNARGSCSIRGFRSSDGRLVRKEYSSGNFQVAFAKIIASAQPVSVTRQPNLEKAGVEGLPPQVLAELQAQAGIPVSVKPSSQVRGTVFSNYGPAHKIEKAWYTMKGPGGQHVFLAFVNAKGNCSVRVFNSKNGFLRKKQYANGDFQDAFKDLIRQSSEVFVSRQPNLEHAGKSGLPGNVLEELKSQVREA